MWSRTHSPSLCACGAGIETRLQAAPWLWNSTLALILTDLARIIDISWLRRNTNLYADDIHAGDLFSRNKSCTHLAQFCCHPFHFEIFWSSDQWEKVSNSTHNDGTFSTTGPTKTSFSKPRWRPIDCLIWWSDIHHPADQQCEYLGVVISYGNFEDRTVRHRVQLATVAFKRLQVWLTGRRGLAKSDKLRLWNTCVLPIATYGIFSTGITHKGAHLLNHCFTMMLRKVLMDHSYITRHSNSQVFQIHDTEPPFLMLWRSADRLKRSVTQRCLRLPAHDLIHQLRWDHLDDIQTLFLELHTTGRGQSPPSRTEVVVPALTCHLCDFSTLMLQPCGNITPSNMAFKCCAPPWTFHPITCYRGYPNANTVWLHSPHGDNFVFILPVDARCFKLIQESLPSLEPLHWCRCCPHDWWTLVQMKLCGGTHNLVLLTCTTSCHMNGALDSSDWLAHVNCTCCDRKAWSLITCLNGAAFVTSGLAGLRRCTNILGFFMPISGRWWWPRACSLAIYMPMNHLAIFARAFFTKATPATHGPRWVFSWSMGLINPLVAIQTVPEDSNVRFVTGPCHPQRRCIHTFYRNISWRVPDGIRVGTPLMVVQVAHTAVKFLEQWNHCVLTFPRGRCGSFNPTLTSEPKGITEQTIRVLCEGVWLRRCKIWDGVCTAPCIACAATPSINDQVILCCIYNHPILNFGVILNRLQPFLLAFFTVIGDAFVIHARQSNASIMSAHR